VVAQTFPGNFIENLNRIKVYRKKGWGEKIMSKKIPFSHFLKSLIFHKTLLIVYSNVKSPARKKWKGHDHLAAFSTLRYPKVPNVELFNSFAANKGNAFNPEKATQRC